MLSDLVNLCVNVWSILLISIRLPISNNIVEVLKLPQAQESILVSIKVFKQLISFLSFYLKLILEESQGFFFFQSPYVTIYVFLEDGLDI